MENLIKNTLLFCAALCACYCILIFGDWYIKTNLNQALKNDVAYIEAKKIEKERRTLEDLAQRKQAISDGFIPVLFPDLMENFRLEYPLIAGVPIADTYYCNEGYGLVRYKSDRFGFRNEDRLWDEKATHVVIGDSFIHGACVADEDTLPAQLSLNLNANVLNLGMASNGPSHYLTYASLFIPLVRPEFVYLTFYPNDNDQSGSSLIEDKYVLQKTPLFSRDKIAFSNPKMIRAEGQKALGFLHQEPHKDLSSFSKKISKFFNSVSNHSRLPILREIITERAAGFDNTKRVITAVKELCDKYLCSLRVSFIPNNYFFRPDTRADSYGDQISLITKNLAIPFVDGRYFIDRSRGSLDFAPKGPHLSPLGYKKMADKMASIEVLLKVKDEKN